MSDTVPMSGGAVHSTVRVWPRLEGIVAFLLAISLYAQEGGSWLLFAALFFVPDISFGGYRRRHVDRWNPIAEGRSGAR